MMILDAEATFVRLDRLRERMDKLEKTPDVNEWQFIRQLISALADSISKSKKAPKPVERKVLVDAPAPVSGEWRELLEVLEKKGISSETRSRAQKRERSS
jgi:hypothetical protein